MSKKGGSKAKTANAGEEKVFKIGDIVLGRIKGYPAWPAKIVDPEKEYLTKEVLKGKPSKKQVHLLKYYTDANYSWSPSGELQPLTAKAIETFLSGKKSGALFKAYKTAQDPEEWEAQQEIDMEKAKNAADNPDEDSEDDVESKPSADNKRKRKAVEKPAKEAGDKKKAKTEKKDTKAKAKPAKKSVGGAAEDMSEGAVKCREWRHKLQKAFLTKGLPDEKDAPTYDAIFKEMETFEHQTKWLVPSKLPKVVKRIATIKEPIPRDGEFNFKSRAAALVEQWKDSLMPDGDADGEEKKADSDPAPAETNGDAEKSEPMEEDKKVETEEVEAPAETEAEPVKADEEMPAAAPAEEPASSATAA